VVEGIGMHMCERQRGREGGRERDKEGGGGRESTRERGKEKVQEKAKVKHNARKKEREREKKEGRESKGQRDLDKRERGREGERDARFDAPIMLFGDLGLQSLYQISL